MSEMNAKRYMLTLLQNHEVTANQQL